MEFNYKEEIKLRLLERKAKNSSYSLRAYSRDLGVSLTSLSSVISGKRNLSFKNAVKIAKSLNFSPVQTKFMLNNLNSKILNESLTDNELVKEDEFNLIANWYSIAMLTLFRNQNTKYNLKALSNKFGVAPDLIKKSIETLLLSLIHI